jgi:hypothetical protein
MVRRNIKGRVHCERHQPFRRGASGRARRQGGKRVGWLRAVPFMSVGADASVRPSPGASLQGGEDRVVLPYERLSLPFAIHPTPAVFVTWARRAAGASAPTVGDVAGCHPTGRGGIRYPRRGRFVNCPYGKNTGADFLQGRFRSRPPCPAAYRRSIFAADYLTTFGAKKPCNSQKLVYNRVVEAERALV